MKITISKVDLKKTKNGKDCFTVIDENGNKYFGFQKFLKCTPEEGKTYEVSTKQNGDYTNIEKMELIKESVSVQEHQEQTINNSLKSILMSYAKDIVIAKLNLGNYNGDPFDDTIKGYYKLISVYETNIEEIPQ